MTARPPDAPFHAVWLAISAATLLLSCVLRVHGGTKVVLPVLERPLPELCLSRSWLQLPCPGCGLTRCFIALGHGNLSAAWRYNPAGLYLFALCVFQLPYRGVQLWRIRRGLREIELGWFGYVAVWLVPVLLLAQWFEGFRAVWR
jgi:hypothetical protein